jgi:hypothetical protein
VGDSQPDSGLPPGELKESLSESHQAEEMTSEATNTDSTQTLTTSSKGSSPRLSGAGSRPGLWRLPR